MLSSSDLRFLSNEMNISLGEVGFLLWKNETKDIQQIIVKILNEEREFQKNNDSRFNPDRRDMADNLLIEFLSSLKL